MSKRITVQPPSTPIVDRNGVPTIEFFTLIERLTQLEIRSGADVPNGNFAAQEKTIYWQTGANTLWLKTTGVTNKAGWVQISNM
jgi:hypothetical protein